MFSGGLNTWGIIQLEFTAAHVQVSDLALRSETSGLKAAFVEMFPS